MGRVVIEWMNWGKTIISITCEWWKEGSLVGGGGVETHLPYRSQPQNVLTLLYLNNFTYLWMEYKPVCNEKWLLFLLWPDQPASSSVASATIYFSPIPLEIIIISFCLAFSFSLSKTQFPSIYTILYITFFSLIQFIWIFSFVLYIMLFKMIYNILWYLDILSLVGTLSVDN